MAAIVASNFAVAAAPKVAARKLSARKAVAVPGEFIFPFQWEREREKIFFSLGCEIPHLRLVPNRCRVISFFLLRPARSREGGEEGRVGCG